MHSTHAKADGSTAHMQPMSFVFSYLFWAVCHFIRLAYDVIMT